MLKIVGFYLRQVSQSISEKKLSQALFFPEGDAQEKTHLVSTQE
jgi:hypothetical protein